MYVIKQQPEDFIVREISGINLHHSGKYAICLLKKRNYNTIRALEQIARILNKPLKDFGFAGNKDRIAVTEQLISVKGAGKKDIERIKLKDIELEFLGLSNEPVSLGDLKGNEFIITARNLKEREMSNLRKKAGKRCIMPNFFGAQRFSKSNMEIGKSLLKCNFKDAVKIILDSNPDNRHELEEFLKNSPNNFIGALKLIPKKLLRIYPNAYQSYLWNEALKEYMKKSRKNIKLPIIGFGTEISSNLIGRIITKIMKEESITPRSFISRQIPELSSEGGLRDAFVGIMELRIVEAGEDWAKIHFKLKKGSYATVAVEYLLNPYRL